MPIIDTDQGASDTGEQETVGAPCGSWAVVADLPADLDASITDATKARALASASWLLWKLSGEQYGVCETALRPCRDVDRRERRWGSWWPVPGWDGWLSWPFDCGCRSSCGCKRLERVTLPGPVRQILEVIVDGIVLDEDAYRCDDRKTLVRVDGGEWPACQDLTQPTTEPGTFGVRILRGRPVPVTGWEAVVTMGAELSKAMTPGVKGCALPERVTSVTRQGITIAVLDPMEFLDKGRTGLGSVDLFLQASNPERLQRRARIASADDLDRGPRHLGRPS